jgi:predicted nucleic acid-binding protein
VQTLTPLRVARALDACEKGMDFADALHVCLSDEATAFCTFDADLRRRAARLLAAPPVLAP